MRFATYLLCLASFCTLISFYIQISPSPECEIVEENKELKAAFRELTTIKNERAQVNQELNDLIDDTFTLDIVQSNIENEAERLEEFRSFLKFLNEPDYSRSQNIEFIRLTYLEWYKGEYGAITLYRHQGQHFVFVKKIQGTKVMNPLNGESHIKYQRDSINFHIRGSDYHKAHSMLDSFWFWDIRGNVSAKTAGCGVDFWAFESAYEDFIPYHKVIDLGARNEGLRKTALFIASLCPPEFGMLEFAQ